MKYAIIALLLLSASIAHSEDNKPMTGTYVRSSDWHYMQADDTAPQCGGGVMHEELEAISQMGTFDFQPGTLIIKEWSEHYIWSDKLQAYVSIVDTSDGGEIWAAGFVVKPGIITFQLQHIIDNKLSCMDGWMATIK